MPSIRSNILITTTVAFAVLLGVVALTARDANAEQTERKFRIGYFEVASYWTSDRALEAFKNGLSGLGWLSRVDFVADARYSPGQGVSQAELKGIAEELMGRKDLDLILVMGTQATRLLLQANNGTTPFLGLDISDAVRSSLVNGPDDSGVENFTTIIQQDLWVDMFQLFHEVVDFKRLGLLVSNDKDSRVFSRVDEARKVSRDRGFELVISPLLEPGEDFESCQKGIDDLINAGVDALFIPPFLCFDTGTIGKYVDQLNAHKIATFTSEGSELIMAGILMGPAAHNFNLAGQLSAKAAVKILQGSKPRSLPMQYLMPPSIGINLKTADKLGIKPSFQLLSVSDEIYLNTHQ